MEGKVGRGTSSSVLMIAQAESVVLEESASCQGEQRGTRVGSRKSRSVGCRTDWELCAGQGGQDSLSCSFISGSVLKNLQCYLFPNRTKARPGISSEQSSAECPHTQRKTSLQG